MPFARTIGRALSRGAAILLAIAVALVVALQILGIPDFVSRWMEDKLSEGPVSCRFDNARLSFDGISIQNVRIHFKHDANHALLTADHISLLFRLRPGKPLASWIYAVSASGVICSHIKDDDDDGENYGNADTLTRICGEIGLIFDHPVGVSIRDSEIMSVKFDDFSGTASVDADGVVLDRIVLTLCKEPFVEKLRGMASISAPDAILNAHIEGTITPDKIERLTLDLEGDSAVEYYHWLSEYTAPLNVVGDIRYELLGNAGRRHVQDMRVAISGANLNCKSLPVDRFNLGVAWNVSKPDESGSQNRSLSVSPLDFHFQDGTIDGSIVWQPITHATDVKATATISIESLATLLDIEIPECTTNLTFATTPMLNASGTIYGGDFLRQSFLCGHMRCDSAAAYGFDFTRLAADFSYEAMQNLSVSNIVATSHGGTITGRVNAVFGDSATEYSVDAGMANVDFGEIRHHVSGVNESGGVVNSRLVLGGTTDTNAATYLAGTYKGSVRNSNLLRIPLFAGLTDFLGRNVPGVDDILMQTDADFTCTLTNNMVVIDNLSIEGNLFSMVIWGNIDVDAPSTPVDLTTQVRFFRQKTLAGKLARLVFLPVSKFMEFRVFGPIENPDWSYIGLLDRIKGLWSSDEPKAGGGRSGPVEEKGDPQ